MSRARAQQLQAQGASRREIADRLGVSFQTVVAWLRRPPTFAERRCRLCGERFVPSNGRQRYCSVEHWYRHRQGEPKMRECRWCDEPFTPASPNQRFCTPEHRAQHNRLHRPPTSTAGWRERVREFEGELVDVRKQLADREAA